MMAVSSATVTQLARRSMRIRRDCRWRWSFWVGVVALAFGGVPSWAQKGQWVAISDGVIAQLQKEGKKIGYPGLTAGVTCDPSTGDVYMVVCDQGLWRS